MAVLHLGAPWSDRLIGLAGAVVGCVIAWYVADPSIHGQAAIFYVLPDAALAFTVAFLILSRWGVRLGTVTALVAGALALGYWDTVRLRRDVGCTSRRPCTQAAWEKTLRGDGSSRNTTPSPPSRTAANAGAVGERCCGRSFADRRRQRRAGRRARRRLEDPRPEAKSGKPQGRGRAGLRSAWQATGSSSLRSKGSCRGDNEDVVCYDAKTGEEADGSTRPKPVLTSQWEASGRRATPIVLAGGRLYVQGAAGLLQCLDPLTGAVKWKRDLLKEADRKKAPIWGYASSPLIVGDKVIVYSSGDEGEKGMLLAFDTATGEPRWTAIAGNSSYSSPQVAKLAGREVVVFWGQTGLTAVDAPTGKPAWNYDWLFQGYRVVQPLLLSETSMLLGTGMGEGTRRVELVAPKGRRRRRGEIRGFRWTSHDMKPGLQRLPWPSTARSTGSITTSSAASTWRPERKNGRTAATATARSCCCPKRVNCWFCQRRGNSC